MLILSNHINRDTLTNPMFIDWRNPINWHNGFNVGLIAWFLSIPGFLGWKTASWKDLSGKYTGSFSGMGPEAWGQGGFSGFNGGINFPGGGGVVEGPISFTAPASIMFWMKTNDTTFTNILEFTNGSDNYITFDIVTQDIRFIIKKASSRVAQQLDQLTTNKWFHVAGVINSGGFPLLYVNGEYAGTNGAGGQFPVVTQYSFGDNPIRAPSVDTFNGQLDDIRIYNKPVDAMLIKGIYIASQRFYQNQLNRKASALYFSTAAPVVSTNIPFDIFSSSINGETGIFKPRLIRGV